MDPEILKRLPKEGLPSQAQLDGSDDGHMLRS